MSETWSRKLSKPGGQVDPSVAVQVVVCNRARAWRQSSSWGVPWQPRFEAHVRLAGVGVLQRATPATTET
jgi:hypothetical protein